VLDQYAPIAVLLILSTAVSLLIVFSQCKQTELTCYYCKREKENHFKLEPYESGMTPIGPAMRRLPVKFYLVAVLFILFDIEVVFFFPFAVVARQLGLFALAEMGVFIGILLVGYVYAWRKGALEWE